MYTKPNYNSGRNFEISNQKALYKDIKDGKYTPDQILEKVFDMSYVDKRGLAKAFDVADRGNPSVDMLFGALAGSDEPVVQAEMVWKGGTDAIETNEHLADIVKYELARYHSMEMECIIQNIREQIKDMDVADFRSLSRADVEQILNNATGIKNAIGESISDYFNVQDYFKKEDTVANKNEYAVTLSDNKTVYEHTPGISFLKGYVSSKVDMIQNNLMSPNGRSNRNERYRNKDLQALYDSTFNAYNSDFKTAYEGLLRSYLDLTKYASDLIFAQEALKEVEKEFIKEPEIESITKFSALSQDEREKRIRDLSPEDLKTVSETDPSKAVREAAQKELAKHPEIEQEQKQEQKKDRGMDI